MKWLDKYDVPKAENGIEGTMGGLTDQGFNYNGAWGGQFAMGGSLPGAVGFTYARTQGAAPSNGPYAKKTKASAENGTEMRFYQEGLDWKPRNISRDGKDVPKGGRAPIFTDNPKDPRIRAYQDSLVLYNNTKGMIDDLKSFEKYYGEPKTGGNKYMFVDQWVGYTDEWYENKGPKVKPAFKRLTSRNNKAPLPQKTYESKIDSNQIAVEYKKPVQPVIYKKPEPVESPAPVQTVEQVVQQSQKVVQPALREYSGNPVYANTPYSRGAGALIGFENKGDTTYIAPEDYERFAVPSYGKKIIEGRKKQRNGGINKADEAPIEKLDQLLNFTNYNKPTKGGWLDKWAD